MGSATFGYNVGVASADGIVEVLMVVEDEPDMATLLRVILAREPRLRIMGTAASAEEALAELDTLHPGLVILDHGLNGTLTGLAAAPLIKQKAPQAKILLFTAYDLASEARKEPAVDAFLRKDRIGDLLPTVQSLLGLEAA